MQTWLSFWNTIFWLALFIFFFNRSNFLDMLLFSEIVWVLLYILAVFFGSIIDDINLYSLSFFLLAFAALEFSIGILILVLFKNFKIDYSFFNNSKDFLQNNSDNNKLFFFNNFYLIKN